MSGPAANAAGGGTVGATGALAAADAADAADAAGIRLGIMQPYFFPYLGYFQGIHAVDKYILHGGWPHIKRGWVHRNRLMVVRQGPAWFKAEVQHRSTGKTTAQIALVEGGHWRRKIMNAFFCNYRSSPFFDDVYPLIEGVLHAELHLLAELNAKSIIDVCRYLDVNTEIVSIAHNDAASEPQPEVRQADAPSASRAPVGDAEAGRARRTARIIGICRAERANIYVNAIGGQALYDREEFARNGVELRFIHTHPHHYRQTTPGFHPNLSILDVLLCCGKEGTKQLLEQYTAE